MLSELVLVNLTSIERLAERMLPAGFDLLEMAQPELDAGSRSNGIEVAPL